MSKENDQKILPEETKIENNANELDNNEYPQTLENEGYTDGVVVTESVKREQEIDYRLGEIAVQIDEYERMLYDENKEIMSKEEYLSLLEEQKSLRQEHRTLRKNRKDSFWDKVKTWQLIYGIVQFIICVPYLGGLYQLTYAVYVKLDEWFADSFANLSADFQNAIQIMMILAFPILNLFLSWLLFVNFTKSKFDKKTFIVIWIMQFILTTISMLMIFI